jgi:hypothetical protein
VAVPGGGFMTDGRPFRRTYSFKPETAHKLDVIALVTSCNKSEVIELLVDLFYDKSPSFSSEVRDRLKEASTRLKQ